MKTNETKRHRLKIQTAALFKANEWSLIDWVYWKSNTQPGRKWTCRISNIKENTSLRRIETILSILARLVDRNIGISKIPFGKPQMRKCGKGRSELVEKQSYQYVFDAAKFDTWLASQPCEPFRKRIDPYPKTDSPSIPKRIDTYPLSDTKRMKEEGEKKEEVQQPDFSPTGSQTLDRFAPGFLEKDLGDAFEQFFNAP